MFTNALNISIIECASAGSQLNSVLLLMIFAFMLLLNNV